MRPQIPSTRFVEKCGCVHDYQTTEFISGTSGVLLCKRHAAWAQRFGPEIGRMIHGEVSIGEGTSLCSPCDINGVDASLWIGRGCDIAAFVTITCADSHALCIGTSKEIERRPVKIGDHVFIGAGAIILGGCEIGDRAVIGAGVVLAKNTIVDPGQMIRSDEKRGI